MSDDRFFDRLREDAKPLRFEPDDVMATRIAARVRDRIAQPDVAGILARWVRPLATTMAAAALAASLGLAWLSHSTDASATPVESVASANTPVEISVAGDVYSVDNQ